VRLRIPSSSPAFQAGFQPPTPLRAEAWRLAPLHPDLAELDFAAWRSCRERLVEELQWNGWPGPTFSLADNIADLAKHFGEFERREAYAYSVFGPEICLGCVYIEPFGDGAQLAFWVIDAALPIEGEVVERVLDWLESWPIERVVVPVRASNRRGRDLLERLGMEPVPGPEEHLSYGRISAAGPGDFG